MMVKDPINHIKSLGEQVNCFVSFPIWTCTLLCKKYFNSHSAIH